MYIPQVHRDQVAIVNICFFCRLVDETPPQPNDDESIEVRYFALDNLPDTLLPYHKQLIALALEDIPGAYFNPPSA